MERALLVDDLTLLFCDGSRGCGPLAEACSRLSSATMAVGSERCSLVCGGVRARTAVHPGWTEPRFNWTLRD